VRPGVAAIALVLLLAGCGGGSSKLSKADLGKQAGAICNKASRDLGAVPQPANIQDANQAATYFEKVVAIADDAVGKLKKLKPEGSVKDAWNKYVAKQQQETAIFHTILNKAKAKDRSGLNDLQKAAALDNQVNAAAKAAGVPDCGKSSNG
jgi:predicted CopG family antitoxin